MDQSYGPLIQDLVKARQTELASSLLETQRWLAAVSALECPVCLEQIALSDEVRRRKDSRPVDREALIRPLEELLH